MDIIKPYPKVTKNNCELLIEFTPGITRKKVVQIKMILDFDKFGEPIGIEILDLKAIAGANILGNLGHVFNNGTSQITINYDQEVDAFGLKLNESSSLDQHAVWGKMILDSNGHLIGISCNYCEG